MNWRQLLAAILRGENASTDQTQWAMEQIVTGRASDAQVAGLAVALRAKGETAEEVAGFAAAMLQHMSPMPSIGDGVDVVGTGGDGANTVNISTMAALVTAGAGAPVIKHGNRAASSKCGSADVLEALGIVLEQAPDRVAEQVSRYGIGFCYARQFHPGLRHVARVRAQLGVPTVFNFLGPLTNPAQPLSAAIGCADETMAPILADVMARRGATALVVRGNDGLDEFTTTDSTHVWVASAGQVRTTTLDAAQWGIPRATRADLAGNDAVFNAAAVKAVLGGERGPVRDATAVNAALALVAYRGFGAAAPGDAELDAAMRQALADATEAIDSGAALRVLNGWAGDSRG